MKNFIRLTLLLSFLVFITACSTDNDNNRSGKMIEAKIDQLIAKMTLKEKVSFTHGNTKFTIPGVERLGIPSWHMSDGPHGVREEIKPHVWEAAGWTTDSCTYFPTGTALTATWNPELAYRFGQGLGAEARAREKDVILGPGINLLRTPLNGRNFEYMGEDPYLISKMVVPVIKGVQENDVAACLKHYAINNQEYMRFKINEIVDERTLREIYLPGYKAAVMEGGVYTVMSAYNKFRGVYCSENSYLLNDILKGEWGFDGVVISDWDGTHSTVGAALGGLDVEMGTNNKDSYDDYYLADPLMEAVENGEVPENVLDDKVRRILRIMFRTGAFDKNRQKGAFTTPDHFQRARKVAEEAIVLLKNENNTLPLKKDQYKTIAVIGDNATREHAYGGGSSHLKAKYEVTPLEGLRNKLGDSVNLVVAQGYEKTTTFSWDKPLSDTFDPKQAAAMRKEAVKTAKSADLVLYFGGLNHDYDTEGWDRPDMKMPYEQDKLIDELIAANPNIVVVLTGGSPMEMHQWLDKVSAVVLGWYAGSESGNVLADVLFGDINPSGKLPFTFPVKLEDSPAHAMNAYPGDDDLNEVYSEGILVGYRWFDTRNVEPQFAFGHGLSYTNFTYSGLQVSPEMKADGQAKISLKVKNSGDRAGAEVVQLYIHDVEASVMRPVNELKGFKKVFLQPGEEQEVSFQIGSDALSFFDEKRGSWNAEAGSFEVRIGSSSRDIRLIAGFELK
jgi:beta-glucosidase